MQRCQSRSKHGNENLLCCRHFSGASLSEKNVLLLWPMPDGWGIQRQFNMWLENSALSISYMGSLDGRLAAIRVNDWAATDYEGAWYTGWTSSANWWTAEMDRSRFPSWPKARERQRQAVSSGPLEKMSLSGLKERVFSVPVIEAPVPVGKTSRRLATNELIEQRHGSYEL